MAGTVHDVENKNLLAQVKEESANAARQLAEAARLHKGQIVVVGCSTSEVVGHNVGSWSTPEVANAIFEGLNSVFAPMGVYIAAQCCEHLNRALIVEHEAVPNGEIVNVMPQPKAGSSFATAAYHSFRHPVALEEIRADAGLDIGGTLIGAIIIGVLNNGLNMLNVSSFWQYVAKGVVILLAVMVDVLRKQSKDKRKALPKKAAKA
mgnify:CR=1 FL=1